LAAVECWQKAAGWGLSERFSTGCARSPAQILTGVVDFSAVSSPELARTSERPTEVDLRVSVGTLHLKNPIIAASGTFGYGLEFAHLVDLNRLGGMVNAIGLQNVGVRAFVTEKLPKLLLYDTPIIANVFGKAVSEYVEVIRVLEDTQGLAAYELNISCPNTERGGIEYGTDPAAAEEVVRAARSATKRPLWVKLSPVVGRIGLIAKACEEAGADALVVANTYPALCIDGHTRKSRLGSTGGGLSGAAIKPITMRLVYESSRAVKIPVVGLGGIEGPADAAEYIIAGASAVEVGTAHFIDPRASENLVHALERWCMHEKVNRISDLRGSLQAEKACGEVSRNGKIR